MVHNPSAVAVQLVTRPAGSMGCGIIMQNADTLLQQCRHFVTQGLLVTSHVYHNAQQLQHHLHQAHPQEAHCYVPIGHLPYFLALALL